MVRLGFIRKPENRIHMPRGLIDDPEGGIADEKVNDGGFGYDIFSADADGINVLLLNVGQHHTAAVAFDQLKAHLTGQLRNLRIGFLTRMNSPAVAKHHPGQSAPSAPVH